VNTPEATGEHEEVADTPTVVSWLQ